MAIGAKELAGRFEPREELEEVKWRLRYCDLVVRDDRVVYVEVGASVLKLEANASDRWELRRHRARILMKGANMEIRGEYIFNTADIVGIYFCL